MRRLRQLSGYSGYLSAELTQPLLNAAELERDAIFRNSMHEAGEDEWACPVCAFSNRPRTPNCDICGLDKGEALRRPAQYRKLAAAACSPACDDDATDDPADGGDEEKGASETDAALGGGADGEMPARLTARQRRSARRALWQREPANSGAELRWRCARAECMGTADGASKGGKLAGGDVVAGETCVAVMRTGVQLDWAPANGHLAGGGGGIDTRQTGGYWTVSCVVGRLLDIFVQEKDMFDKSSCSPCSNRSP